MNKKKKKTRGAEPMLATTSTKSPLSAKTSTNDIESFAEDFTCPQNRKGNSIERQIVARTYSNSNQTYSFVNKKIK